MSSPNDRAERDKGPLADFSITQVVVAGLAAATSFALSSQIGIAGSAIGAVIGAVASAAASQVYRKLIDTSKEKLRSFGEAGDGTAGAGAQTAPDGQAPAEETALWQPASLSGRVVIDGVSESGTPIAPREVRYAARAREQARIRRRVAVVGAAVGVVAVLAFALVAYVATRGAGIGQMPSERTVAEEGVQAGGADSPGSPASPEPSTPSGTDSTEASSEGASTDAAAPTTDSSSDTPSDATPGSIPSTGETGTGSDSGTSGGGGTPSSDASGTTGAGGDAPSSSGGSTDAAPPSA